MKITKYLHSCLLIERNNTTILVDPGNYTYQEKVFPFEKIETIDYITITHEHQDHMDMNFLKEALQRYPKMQIIANESIKNILLKENIVTNTASNQFVTFTPLKHEKVLNYPLPINWGITLFDEFLHPGDSLQFMASPRILALPVQAPWGSMVQAAEQALVVKPQTIIPIHDYHWKDDARKAFYQWLTAYFQQHNITFISAETGQTNEL